MENKERTSSPHFHAMFPHIEQSGIVSYLPSVMSESPCKLRFWRVQSPQRAVGRVAEGAPLLREYGYKTPIEGSNPSLSAKLLSPPSAGSIIWWTERSDENPLVRQIAMNTQIDKKNQNPHISLKNRGNTLWQGRRSP